MGTPLAAPFGATAGCPLGLEWSPVKAQALAAKALAALSEECDTLLEKR
jgi:hypothetical protein